MDVGRRAASVRLYEQMTEGAFLYRIRIAHHTTGNATLPVPLVRSPANIFEPIGYCWRFGLPRKLQTECAFDNTQM